MLIEEIFSLLSELPLEIQPEIEFINDLTIDIIGCNELINNYIKADEEDKRDYYTADIEVITERDKQQKLLPEQMQQMIGNLSEKLNIKKIGGIKQ